MRAYEEGGEPRGDEARPEPRLQPRRREIGRRLRAGRTGRVGGAEGWVGRARAGPQGRRRERGDRGGRVEERTWKPARRARGLSGRARAAACFGLGDGATVAREQSGLIAKRRRRPDGAGAAQRRGGGSRTRSEDGGDATTRGAGIRNRNEGGGAARAAGRECARSRGGGAGGAGGWASGGAGKRKAVCGVSALCALSSTGEGACVAVEYQPQVPARHPQVPGLNCTKCGFP